ncbi:MAG: nucleoside-diphosphate sugar epimerase/dehydratase, partial [Candidatus Dormibacteraceae bacterium]
MPSRIAESNLSEELEVAVQPGLSAAVTPATWPVATSRRKWEWQALIVGLIATDGVVLGLAFALAYLIRFKLGIPLLATPQHSLAFYSSVVFWAIPVWLAIFALYRLFDRHFLFAGFQEYIHVVNACTAGVLALIVISFLDTTLILSRGWLLLTWLLAVLLVGASRFAIRRLLRQLRRHGWLLISTVIVGANEEARALAEQFLSDHGSGARVVGFIASDPRSDALAVGEIPILGGLSDLSQIVKDRGVSEVVVATTALAREQLLELYRTFGHVADVEIRLSSGVFEILTTGVRVQQIGGVPLVTPQRIRITGIDAFLKAGLDYVGAALTLALLSPV